MENNGIYAKLQEVQNKLVVPKDEYNKFGGYKYRTCESILRELKPLLDSKKLVLTLSDNLEVVADRFYIRATARVIDAESGEEIETHALAREEQTKKGMDSSQITGAASSYARKYALNGMFAIDDTKDSDFTNKQTAEPEQEPPVPTDSPDQGRIQEPAEPKQQTQQVQPRKRVRK